ncbi:MAG: phosphoribosylglycinamide formyltransferase [Rikenellaceae bacterium]|jgi:phosphoribosylglycinamide formyltransferase-1|nr:phosphoribosylglycinamide formyltransferase [Rikenellaceae bacterium]
MNNIAIFASGKGSNMVQITRKFEQSESISVRLVVASRASAGVLEHAKSLGVESVIFTKNDLANPETLLTELRARNIEWLVLAGWLLLLPAEIIEAYRGRIINVHPSLLPEFGGRGMFGHHVHEAVIAAGRTRSGITIHLVDEHYDQGSILAQFECEVLPDDTPQTLEARIHELEYRHYPEQIEKLILKHQ